MDKIESWTHGKYKKITQAKKIEEIGDQSENQQKQDNTF